MCFHRTEPASSVAERAQQAETIGFDEFWVIEDCFWTAGVSLATASLSATSTITVGLGIMPVRVRNAALTAMEIATIAGLAPGRFHAGLGHGVQDWMDQMGLRPSSPLTALEETFDAVQRLLRGETVSMEGAYVTLRDVALVFPPTPKPLVSAGVRGPKSLAVAGRLGDGTILADFVGPAYVRQARDHIEPAAAGSDHRLTVFASAAIGRDAQAMREAIIPHLADVAEQKLPSIVALPFYEDLARRAERAGWVEAVSALPAEHWLHLGPIGTPDDAAAHIEALADAGADAVALFPSPHAALSDASQIAQDLLPLVQSR